MAVTVNGKKYKGKYKGPDKFKGDAKKIAAWKASQRAATKPAPAAAPAAAAPSAPTAPPDPTAVSAYASPNPNATAANATGTIQLQSNYEIDMAEADAQEAIDQEIAAANTSKEQALITEKLQREQFGRQQLSDKGSINTSLAYRGLTRGTTATDQTSKMVAEHSRKNSEIESQKAGAVGAADAVITGAPAKRAALDKRFAAARQSYTNSQSRNSPTEGSQAEDSGVSPTGVPAESSEATQVLTPAASSTSTTTKTYKGKYKGPDKFKGNAKKIAAWKAAKRKAGK